MVLGKINGHPILSTVGAVAVVVGVVIDMLSLIEAECANVTDVKKSGYINMLKISRR